MFILDVAVFFSSLVLLSEKTLPEDGNIWERKEMGWEWAGSSGDNCRLKILH